MLDNAKCGEHKIDKNQQVLKESNFIALVDGKKTSKIWQDKFSVDKMVDNLKIAFNFCYFFISISNFLHFIGTCYVWSLIYRNLPSKLNKIKQTKYQKSTSFS